MDEKEKEIELENEAQAEENSASEQEDTSAEDTQAEQESAVDEPEEGEGWQFDASAPTLEDNLDIGNDYEIEVAEESEEAAEETAEETANEYKEVPSEEVSEIREYKQEPLDDDEEEKVKRNFIVNKKALKIGIISAVCVIAVALIAFFGIRFFLEPNTNEIMTPGNLALTIGETKISVGYYNYYYNSTVNTYLENAQAGYIDLKVDEDYSKQITTDDDGNQITWEQKFREDTIWQLQYLTAYYEAAVKAGITLTDEQKETIDTSIKSIESYAAQEEQSVKAYLAENAGENCGIKTMRTIYERLTIAQTYFSQMNMLLSASEEEIQAAFEENKNNYKAATFAYIELPYSDDDDIEKVKAKADAYCAEIKSLTDMKNLIPEVCKQLIEQYIAYGYAKDEKEAVKAISESMQYTYTRDEVKSYFNSEEIADWVYSNDTKVGSVASFVDEDYSCIDILFKVANPSLDETKYYSVRHILIMPHSEDDSEDDSQSSTDKEYTEAEWAKALEKAESIVEEYNATDKTEIAFSELAEKYSEDTSSTSAGGYGYYGGEIFKAELGRMVPEFEAWGADSSRKYGDVGIVKSKYGYHIMYFVFSGPSYMYNAKDDADELKQDEFIAKCTVTEEKAIEKTTVAKAKEYQK